jgi:flagellar basal-body rod protein FlgG
VGNGSRVSSTSKVFTQGQLSNTGVQLDLAIQGDGFFELQKPDGTLAYTRDGAFQQNASGQIVTTDGLPVVGFQPVPQGTTSISISQDGEVTTTSASGNQSYRITLTRFANPAGLKSIGGNMYEETKASGTPEQGSPTEAGFGSVMQGYVENSNVNIVEEMVNLIVAQRAYEINSKSIQTSDEMLQNVAQMKR